MSSEHAHAAGGEHKPHVLPLRIYLAVAAGLLSLTWLTVWVSYFDIGAFNVVVAMAVATIKASLVTLFFMHLKYDERFNALVFVSAFAFLSLFFVFTLADTARRGEVDPVERGIIQVVPESSIPHDAAGADSGHGSGDGH
jgi:cytochrome c oxidase subunit 4